MGAVQGSRQEHDSINREMNMKKPKHNVKAFLDKKDKKIDTTKQKKLKTIKKVI